VIGSQRLQEQRASLSDADDEDLDGGAPLPSAGSGRDGVADVEDVPPALVGGRRGEAGIERRMRHDGDPRGDYESSEESTGVGEGPGPSSVSSGESEDGWIGTTSIRPRLTGDEGRREHG